jgi:hypothetical protein
VSLLETDKPSDACALFWRPVRQRRQVSTGQSASVALVASSATGAVVARVVVATVDLE